MQKVVSNIVQQFCSKICINMFKNSESLCIEKHSENIGNLVTTLQQIKLQKTIDNYCQTHKNRFWILYYSLVETEIPYQCRTAGSEKDKCRDYILDKIIEPMKKFDINYESIIFKKLSLFLFESEEPNQDKEIILMYANKIEKNYRYRTFNIEKASALLENALEAYANPKYSMAIHSALEKYKSYNVEVKLEEICMLAFHKKEIKENTKEEEFSKYVLTELLYQEKFIVYIKQAMRYKFIDFIKSKAFKLVESDEIDIHVDDKYEIDEEYEDSLLQVLNEEHTLLNKLKYGFTLDNKEFITVCIKLDYDDIDLLENLTSEEKFYIKLVTKYALEDDSEQLKIFDIEAIKESIHNKISKKRENLQSYSYSEYEESEKREIYLKLLYAEGLSSKEMGLIFDLTAKQIDKKIENSKKKLKRML